MCVGKLARLMKKRTSFLKAARPLPFTSAGNNWTTCHSKGYSRECFAGLVVVLQLLQIIRKFKVVFFPFYLLKAAGILYTYLCYTIVI